MRSFMISSFRSPCDSARTAKAMPSPSHCERPKTDGQRQFLLRRSDSILPVRPREPDYSRRQGNANDGIELVKIFAQRAPIFAQLHLEPSQREAPGPGTEKGVEMKSSTRHSGNSRRQCDESADYREQSSDEDRQVSPARAEAVGPIQFSPAHKNPATVFFDQGATTVASDLVRDQRSQVAADGAGSGDPEQFHCAFEHQIAGERHN